MINKFKGTLPSDGIWCPEGGVDTETRHPLGHHNVSCLTCVKYGGGQNAIGDHHRTTFYKDCKEGYLADLDRVDEAIEGLTQIAQALMEPEPLIPLDELKKLFAVRVRMNSNYRDVYETVLCAFDESPVIPLRAFLKDSDAQEYVEQVAERIHHLLDEMR